MSYEDYFDKNVRFCQENGDKDLDIEKLTGSFMITNEDDLITQIRKWYQKTSFKSFLQAIEQVVHGQCETSICVYQVYFYLETIVKGQKVNKQRVILAGPSGCGKTETYRALKEYFEKEIPKLVVSLIDMTQITAEGFVGHNTSFIVQGLKRGRSRGIGILFLDEFDKRCIPSHSSQGDNVNREIQSQLLLTIEGCELDGIDTKMTMIFAMGSFNEIRERRARAKQFGFNVDRTEKVIEHYAPITREDIIELGASYELIGRFSQVVNYGPLTPEAIDRIIDMRIDNISASRGIKVSVSDNMRHFLHNVSSNSEFGNRQIAAHISDAVTRAMVETLTNEINAEEIVIIGPGKYIIKETGFPSGVLKKSFEQKQKKAVEREINSKCFAPFISLSGKKGDIKNQAEISFSDCFPELEKENEIEAMVDRMNRVTKTDKEKGNDDRKNKNDCGEDKEFHNVFVACKKDDKARSIAKLIAQKNGQTVKTIMEKLKNNQSVPVTFRDVVDAIVFKTSILSAGGEAWFDART